MDRPALDKLREAITAFGIEIVIVLDIDRLARKTVYQMLIEEDFAKLGAMIEYVNGRYAESDEGRLQKHIKAAIAEYERAKILERMKRGKIGKAKQGKVLISNYPPYGYRKAGGVEAATLVVHEPEAAVVRRIFEWYITGNGTGELLSTYTIARRLTAEHTPLPLSVRGGSGLWQPSTIANILRNEAYIGTWYYNKSRRAGSKVRRSREEWVAVPVPSIVGSDVLEIARTRAQQNKARAARNRKQLYLFSGLLTHKLCGRLLSGHANRKWRYYRCSRTQAYYEHLQCTLPHVAERALDTLVWAWLIQAVDDPERTVHALNERQAQFEEQNDRKYKRLADIDQKLAELGTQRKRLVDAFAVNPELPEDWLTEHIARLDKLRYDYEQERSSLQAEFARQPYSPDRMRNVIAFLEELRGRMARATPEKKRQTYVALSFTAEITVEGGHKVAYVSCVLGEKRLTLANKAP